MIQRELTKNEKKVLGLLERSLERRGYPPTVREIAKFMKFRSHNSAYYYLVRLEKKGYIRRRVSSGGKRKSARGMKEIELVRKRKR